MHIRRKKLHNFCTINLRKQIVKLDTKQCKFYAHLAFFAVLQRTDTTNMLVFYKMVFHVCKAVISIAKSSIAKKPNIFFLYFNTTS